MIHLVKAIELEAVDRLSVSVIQQMKQDGIPQWDETYPRARHFLHDIRHAALWGYYQDGHLLGVACIDQTHHASYSTLPWTLPGSMIVHRLLVDPTAQGQGIGKALLAHAETLGQQKNAAFVKIDTHPDNVKMLGLLQHLGYRHVGFLDDIHRVAFEKEIPCLSTTSL
jgi:GNAT superfamily N-acetyltransferase